MAGAGIAAGVPAPSSSTSANPVSSAAGTTASASGVAQRDREWEAEVSRVDVVQVWNLVVRVGSMAASFTPGDWGRLYSMNKVCVCPCACDTPPLGQS